SARADSGLETSPAQFPIIHRNFRNSDATLDRPQGLECGSPSAAFCCDARQDEEGPLSKTRVGGTHVPISKEFLSRLSARAERRALPPETAQQFACFKGSPYNRKNSELREESLEAALDDTGGDSIAREAGGVVDAELLHEALPMF